MIQSEDQLSRNMVLLFQTTTHSSITICTKITHTKGRLGRKKQQPWERRLPPQPTLAQEPTPSAHTGLSSGREKAPAGRKEMPQHPPWLPTQPTPQ